MDDVLNTHDRFVARFISLVREREALWLQTHPQFKQQECQNRYWKEVVYQLQIISFPENITVKLCKIWWSRLLETFHECVEHPTASTFKWSDHLCFLGVPRSDRTFVGIFEREHGKWLLTIHIFTIIMSVFIFILMDCYSFFPPMASPSIMNTVYCWSLFASFCGFYSALLPLRYGSKQYPGFFILTESIGLIGLILVLLHIIPTAELELEIYRGFHYNIFLAVLFLKLESFCFHITKLTRPPALIEYSSQLILLIGSAVVLLFLVPCYEWTWTYIYFPVALLGQAIVIGAYISIAKWNSSQYQYQEINNYFTSPEQPAHFFSLVVRNNPSRI